MTPNPTGAIERLDIQRIQAYVDRALNDKNWRATVFTESAIAKELFGNVLTDLPACLTELASLREQLADALKWKEEDPRMLREQIRVADVAYQHLHGENKGLREQVERLEKERDAKAERIKEQQAVLNDLKHRDHLIEKENDHLRTELAQAREAIRLKDNALLRACIGSCKCLTKTPEAEFHDEHCPYKEYRAALSSPSSEPGRGK